MVLEYESQHSPIAPFLWPSYVGKYTSTMEHMGMNIINTGGCQVGSRPSSTESSNLLGPRPLTVPPIWGFLKWGLHGATPIAGWFIMENPIHMNDLGVYPFQETSMVHISFEITRSLWKAHLFSRAFHITFGILFGYSIVSSRLKHLMSDSCPSVRKKAPGNTHDTPLKSSTSDLDEPPPLFNPESNTLGKFNNELQFRRLIWETKYTASEPHH